MPQKPTKRKAPKTKIIGVQGFDFKKTQACGISGETVFVPDEVLQKIVAKYGALSGPHGNKGIVVGKQPPYSYHIRILSNDQHLLLDEEEFQDMDGSISF